jgi:hypothetical protein
VFQVVSNPLFTIVTSSLLIKSHWCDHLPVYPNHFLAGERLAFVGKIRFEKSAAPGVASSCNPFTWSDSLIRCSDIWMYTQKAGIHEWHRVAIIATDESDVDNGWYVFILFVHRFIVCTFEFIHTFYSGIQFQVQHSRIVDSPPKSSSS